MYWASGLEPLLYPTGCSFYRPFSFREEYVVPSILNVFKNRDQLERLLSLPSWNNGIFGIRFHSEAYPDYRGVFVPLRLVALTDVEIADTVQVYFRVGDYISLSDQGALRSLSLQGMVDYARPENTLLIELPQAIAEQFQQVPHHADLPARLWDRLAEDPSLSPAVREHFVGTTVLRLVQVSPRGATIPHAPEFLETIRKRQKVYGFRLRAGTVYDFDLAYNRILAAGQGQQQLPFDFGFTGPKEHYNISREIIPITGNYRKELVWIQAKSPRPGTTLLEWIGVRKTAKEVAADPTGDKVLGLRVPVLSYARFWTKARARDGALATVFLAFTSLAFYFAITLPASAPPPVTPPGVPSPAGPTIPSGVLIAIGAFFAGLFGTFLKDFVKGENEKT